ncbi:MAG: tetratricopeptide repeat protein [Planctomycetes bacterium]|nr:tetratricopeptide repeat protein [Planctomycetota bacterium]
MRTVNIPRLIALVVGVAIAAGIAYAVHRMQMPRHAESFLNRARLAQQSEDWSEAIGFYDRYLRLVPDDMDARAELGLLQAKLGRDGQAIVTLEHVHNNRPEDPVDPPDSEDLQGWKIPDNTEVRRTLVEILLRRGRFSDAEDYLTEYLLKTSPDDGQLVQRTLVKALLDNRRFSDAERHLTDLLKTSPDDGQLLYWRGRCQVDNGEEKEDYEEARRTLEKAIKHPPKQFEPYVLLANVLETHLDLPKDADQWLEKMVAAMPQSSEAHLFRGVFLRNHERLTDAADEATEAVRLAPDAPEALWLAAQCDLSNKQYETARKHAKHGIEKAPEEVNFYLILARIELADGHPDRAAAPIKKLKELGNPENLADFFEAQIEYGQGQWLAASRALERARPGLHARKDLLRDANLQLAECYALLGNPDLESAAVARAREANPLSIPARRRWIGELLKTGKLDDAIREQRSLAGSDKAEPKDRARLAELLLYDNMRTPPDKREWSEVNSLLDQAAKEMPGAVEVTKIRSLTLLARGLVDEAEQLLIRSRDEKPDEPELWLNLIGLAASRKQPDRVDTLLADARTQLRDIVPLRLAEADLLLRRGDEEVGARLRLLAEPPKQTDPLEPPVEYTDSQRFALWNGLARAAMAARDYQHARELCAKLAKLEPNNLEVLTLAFDVERRARSEPDATPDSPLDTAALDAILDKIERIDGKGPVWLHAMAMRDLLSVQDSQDGGRALAARAREHLVQAKKLRPTWSKIPGLLARIDDARGDTESALKHLQEAIKLGHRSEPALRRVVDLLFQEKPEGWEKEADRMIGLLENARTPLSGTLGIQASAVRWKQGDFSSSLETARKVAADSERFGDHIFLAQVLERTAGRVKEGLMEGDADQLLEEAKEALRRAVELAEGAPGPWTALVFFLARADRKDEAEETISNMEKAMAGEEIGEDRQALALARCWAVIGKIDKAVEHYENALGTPPGDPRMILTVATEYLRIRRFDLAAVQLRRITQGTVAAEEAAVVMARRLLAGILPTSRSFVNLEEAIGLLDKNLAVDDQSVADRRTKALLLAAHPGLPQRREARRMLETLQEQGHLAELPEYLTLAQCFIRDHEWAKARDLFILTILPKYPDRPECIAAYVTAMLDREDTTDVRLWLARLEKLAPHHFGTTKLRARALLLGGRKDEAVKALEKYADDPEALPADPAARQLAVASTLEQLARRPNSNPPTFDPELLAQAEAMFRQYVEQQPDNRLELARFLAARHQFDEALKLAEETWETGNPNTLGAFLTGMIGGLPGSDPRLARVETLLQAAIEKYDRGLFLLLLHGQLLTRQERFDEVESLYRGILVGQRHFGEMTHRNMLRENTLSPPALCRWFIGLRTTRQCSNPYPAPSSPPPTAAARTGRNTGEQGGPW